MEPPVRIGVPPLDSNPFPFQSPSPHKRQRTTLETPFPSPERPKRIVLEHINSITAIGPGPTKDSRWAAAMQSAKDLDVANMLSPSKSILTFHSYYQSSYASYSVTCLTRSHNNILASHISMIDSP